MEYKKVIIFLSIIVIIVSIVLVIFFIIGKNSQNAIKEKSIEEVIKEDLTAPTQEEPQISEDIMKNLNAPLK